MSDIGKGLRARLADNAGVSALVSGRIGPAPMEASIARPYIALQRISMPRDRDLGGANGRAVARYQVTAWGDDPLTANNVAAAVRAALDGYAGAEGGVTIRDTRIDDDGEIYDEAARLWGVRHDYLVEFIES